VNILTGTSSGLYRLFPGKNLELEVPAAGLHRRGSKTWMLTADRALYRSMDHRTWELVAPLREWPGTCVAATSHGVLIGTAEAHLLRLRQGLSAVQGFDAAPERHTWYTPWGGPPATRSLSEGPDGTLFANVHVGGILRSRDGGESWEPTIDIHTDVHQVLAHPTESSVVLAATGSGFALSRDAGDSWEFQNDGLHATYCRAVALADEFVLVSASRSHRGEQGAVYRKAWTGWDSFQRCADGLPDWFDGNVDSHCVAGSGSTVALGSPEGSVFISEDHGLRWEEAAGGLDTITCVAFG
jgi:hypothetical protein